MKKIFIVIALLFLPGQSHFLAQEKTENKYLAEAIPDSTPVLFAKGIVSSQYFEHSSPEFSKDGSEMFWTVIPGEPGSEAFIYSSKKENDKWSVPERVTFLGGNDDMYPFFAFDYQRIYFSSSRPSPKDSSSSKRSIWYVNAAEGKHSKPVYVGFDSLDIYGLFVAKSGNLYFMAQKINEQQKYDLYFSLFVNGNYPKPEKMPEPINSQYYEDNPYLFDDEKQMIFESNRPGGLGGTDLYLSTRNSDGTWSDPKNLDIPINTKSSERFAKISSDGKFFFWGSNINSQVRNYDFDIYWISASMIYNKLETEK